MKRKGSRTTRATLPSSGGSPRKPKVLVLTTGGTWMMQTELRTNHRGVAEEVQVPRRLGDAYPLAREFPSLTSFCEASFHEIRAIDSSNMRPDHWTEVAQAIVERRDEFDGFVGMQGTDTLAYTSCALAFALRGLGKPVIVSGAQISKNLPGSDAPANLVNSCRLAAISTEGTYERGLAPALQEVAVCFGSRIIRGTRARKYSERDLEAFDSVNSPLLGRIELQPRLSSAMLDRMPRVPGVFSPAVGFDAGVALLYLYPGMNPEVIRIVGGQSSGLVLAGFGSGNVPSSTDEFPNDHSLEAAIRDVVASRRPVVITTQCVWGRAEGIYEGGSAARRAGAIIANDLTPECALVKLSWLLANPDRWPSDARRAARGAPGWMEGMRRAVITNLVGEMSENEDLRGVRGP